MVLLLGLFYLYPYLDKQRQIATANNEIEQLKKIEHAAENKLCTLKQEKADYEQLRSDIATIFNTEHATLENSLNQILHYAEGSQLLVNSYEEKNIKDKSLYTKRNLHINLHGSFFNLMNFLQTIEHGCGINKIQELTIKREKEGQLDVKVICNIYTNED